MATCRFADGAKTEMGLFCVVAGFVFLASGVVGADKNVTIQLKNGRSLLVGEDNLDQLPGMLIHDLRLENPPEIAIQLIRRFPDLHLSQRLGTFLNLIGLDENGRKVNRIQEVVQDYYSLSPRLLLNLVGTEELKSFEDLADLGEEIGQETLEQIPLPAVT